MGRYVSVQESIIELLEILTEAEDDEKNERVEPVENTFRDLRHMLKRTAYRCSY